MRKISKAAAALTAGCMLLSTSAFAAIEDNIDGKALLVNGEYTVNLDYTTAGQSTIIVLTEGTKLADANEDNILYINQGKIDEETGEVSYDINLGTSFAGNAVVYAGGTAETATELGTLTTIKDVVGLTLAADKTTLEIGETATITPTFNPEDATDKTLTWTTSNDAIATVANGVVTAVSAGTATITATTTNGKSATIDITVNAAIVPDVPKLPETATVAVRNLNPYEKIGYAVVKVTGIDSGSVAIKDADGNDVAAYLADYTADGGIRQYVAIVKGTEFTTDDVIWDAEGTPDTIAFGDGSDLNGAATIGDVSYVLNVVGKVVIITTDDNKRFLATDIDGNGAITIGDVSATLNLVGKIDLIPGAGK